MLSCLGICSRGLGVVPGGCYVVSCLLATNPGMEFLTYWLLPVSCVFDRLCLVIPIPVVTYLPMRHVDAHVSGMAATIIVCFSPAFVDALRPIFLKAL